LKIPLFLASLILLSGTMAAEIKKNFEMTMQAKICRTESGGMEFDIEYTTNGNYSTYELSDITSRIKKSAGDMCKDFNGRSDDEGMLSGKQKSQTSGYIPPRKKKRPARRGRHAYLDYVNMDVGLGIGSDAKLLTAPSPGSFGVNSNANAGAGSGFGAFSIGETSVNTGSVDAASPGNVTDTNADVDAGVFGLVPNVSAGFGAGAGAGHNAGFFGSDAVAGHNAGSGFVAGVDVNTSTVAGTKRPMEDTAHVTEPAQKRART
jgi:hypothetical protein